MKNTTLNTVLGLLASLFLTPLVAISARAIEAEYRLYHAR